MVATDQGQKALQAQTKTQQAKQDLRQENLRPKNPSRERNHHKEHQKEKEHDQKIAAKNQLSSLNNFKLVTRIQNIRARMQAGVQAVRNAIPGRSSSTDLDQNPGGVPEAPKSELRNGSEATNRVAALAETLKNPETKGNGPSEGTKVSPGEYARGVAENLKSTNLSDPLASPGIGARSHQRQVTSDGTAAGRLSMADAKRMGLSHTEVLTRRVAEMALVVFEFLAVWGTALKRMSSGRKERSEAAGEEIPMCPTHEDLALQMRYAKWAAESVIAAPKIDKEDEQGFTA